MKLSDYVIEFLHARGVNHVFGMSGGAAVHLLDSVARKPGMNFVCSQHEQHSAISADGYPRATGKLGVAITTSGPGATNLLTGSCCSYFDSVPTLMLCGQVATHRLKGQRDIRQMGFQETDVVAVFSSVTKYAVQLTEPEDIRYILEKAYHTTFDGRPGTVLIDIPDDLQRAEIIPSELTGYAPVPDIVVDEAQLRAKIRAVVEALRAAERPVVILGGGLKTPETNINLLDLLERVGAPVLASWAAIDLVPDDHLLKIGAFGVYGPRTGNFAVQNADFVLCLGTRLSQNLTGGILDSFAREASIAMIDASQGEMEKFDGRGITIAHRILSRLDAALPMLMEAVKTEPVSAVSAGWLAQIATWKRAFANDLPDPPAKPGHIGAYAFVRALSRHTNENQLIFADTGGNLTWTCNGFHFKSGQRLYSAWNNTPMGYALPAAIGASVAFPDQTILCLIGDGGLMICLSELATLAKRELNVHIYLFNNHGHGIQKQTLETWLGAQYVGVDESSGLAFTDFAAVARSMGLKTVTLHDAATMDDTLQNITNESGPLFVNVEIDPDQRLFPVLKYGAALEDQLPTLAPNVVTDHMIIPPFNG